MQSLTHPARASALFALAVCIVAMPQTARGEDADPAPAPVVIQLRVLQGEGAVYAPGTRATRGLTILVTDEAGKPVEGAVVSFQLPNDGPGGLFGGGGKTEIATTKTDGIAAVWGMQWDKTPGTFEIKVTASKGQARAGIAVTQYLSTTAKPTSGGEGNFTASHHSMTKWLIIGAVVAGGAAAGIGLRGSKSSSTPAPATTPTQVGNPTIYVGHP